MTVSPQRAKDIALQYLRKYRINVRLSAKVEAFYGYYVIEYMKWGKVVGMISINGYTGEAFSHGWHQNFLRRQLY